MKKITKKALVLALSGFLFLGSGVSSFADELTDPYIPRIRSGEIKPPQYADSSVSGNSPNIDEWIKSVEHQDRGNVEGAVKWSKDKKSFKIKKTDKNGNPIEGAIFASYNTREDAVYNVNPIEQATSSVSGEVVFKKLPSYYSIYIKEIKAPDGLIGSNEIIPVYIDNGVRFLGEKDVTNVKLIKIGEKKESLNVNLNEYLQSLVSEARDMQDNRDVSWLVFNDNGIEKLTPKKPLKYLTRWKNISQAGLVFGNKELILNGKKYKVRLMKAYNDSISIHDGGFDTARKEKDTGKNEKGSEWNRLMLPIIGVNGDEKNIIERDNYARPNTDYVNKFGRFGSNSQKQVEENMPIIARYTWARDLGGGNDSYTTDYNYPGSSRWMQNSSRFDYRGRAMRGSSYISAGAAASGGDNPNYREGHYGWQPILELVDSNETN